MPTYQYACTECGHGFEAFQAFTDDALTDCPRCTGRLRKVFNSVGVVFKGSGFYRTDSREAAKAAAGSDKSADAKSDKKADAKSDTAKKSDSAGSSSTAGSSTPAASKGSSSTKGSAA